MTQSVIFDMDGTLFQTDRILELSLEDTFNQLRLQNKWNDATPIVQYREIMGVPLPKVWAALLPNHSEEVREEANDYFLECLVKNIKAGQGALYPHVEEVFQYLKENQYEIYIASNGLTDYLNAIVGYYQLDQWVTETFSIQEIKSLDKADLVHHIMKKYEITQGTLVGDRLSDFRAAKENGLKAIGCRFDFARKEELSEADLVIEDLMELQSIENK
ncbi:HAD hydrolase-like protein [Halobacillus halophilus]|uniref:HAD hydrolase-like protein n=1 Tax=Halobacillus halophilus TaxID=1570 RepID=UPI001CD50C13|nr:HAD hydrolase-like protein [Halobacillus halophilus]MCA1010451.1 HAD hydrolase-like protein [Halobacillus halophilus]